MYYAQEYVRYSQILSIIMLSSLKLIFPCSAIYIYEIIKYIVISRMTNMSNDNSRFFVDHYYVRLNVTFKFYIMFEIILIITHIINVSIRPKCLERHVRSERRHDRLFKCHETNADVL